MASLGATEFGETVIATLRKIEPELYDNVTLRHPTLDLLRNEQKSETGRALVVPLELGLNDSTTLTDRSGTFNTDVTDDIIGGAEFKWSAPIVSSVRLRWKDLQENQGAQQQINLLKTHIRNMQYSHGRTLVRMLHARADQAAYDASTSPTGIERGLASGYAGPAEGQFHSLDQLVSNATYDADPDGATGQPAFSVGGIDASTQELWQGHRIEVPLDDDMTIRQVFRHVENEVFVATHGKNMIDHIVCGRTVFEEFVDSFDDKVVYDDSFAEGQAKFTQVKHGSLIVRLDPDCPPRRAYFAEKGTLVFRSLAGNFMSPQDVQKIQGTFDVVTPAASVLSVGVNERRANGVLLRPTTAGGDA